MHDNVSNAISSYIHANTLATITHYRYKSSFILVIYNNFIFQNHFNVLLDAVEQHGHPSLFITISPYEWYVNNISSYRPI